MYSVFRFALCAGSLLGVQSISGTAGAQAPDEPPPPATPPVPDSTALVSPPTTASEAPPPEAHPSAPPATPALNAGETRPTTAPSDESSKTTGLYAEVSLGVGGPFGGNTTDRLRQGFGATVAAGYAFHPNFGVNLFSHYNRVRVAVRRSADQPETNEGEVRLLGLEVRGLLGAGGPIRAWGSLGAAFGSGELRYGYSVNGVNLQAEGKADFAFMPVLAFGADAQLGSGFRLGPQVRWYLTSVDQACIDDDCTSDTSNEIAPDIVYFGLALSYAP